MSRGPALRGLIHTMSLLLATVFVSAGSCGGGGSGPLAPSAGVRDYQRRAFLSVPGVPGLQVNAAGGNLLLRRTDLSIDTRLGTYEIASVYNAGRAAHRGWTWSFEPRYDGSTFVDPTGARHELGGLADGEPVRGTHWTRVSASQVATRGGLLYTFHAERGDLLEIRRRSASLPRLAFVKELVDPDGDGRGRYRTDRIEQCTQSGCTLVYDLEYDDGPGSSGKLVSVTDRAGRRATYAYDADGLLRAARDGLDVAEGWPGFRYEYVGSSKLLSAVTSSEGERVELGYRPAHAGPVNRVTSIVRVGAESPSWSLGYEAPSDGIYATTVVDPEAHESRLAYDGKRRLRSVENAAGEVTRWQWSGRRPTRRSEPSGTTTTFGWSADRLVTKTLPSGNTLAFTYQPGGVNRADPSAPPLRRLEDDLGLVAARSYDARGRLISVTNGAGETTTLAYASDQTVASVTSPAGVTVELLGYGEHGHPTRIVADGEERTRVFDAVGNLTQGPDLAFDAGPGLGGVVARSFDADRNVSAVELADQGYLAPTASKTLTIEHRSDGRRTRIRRPYGGDTVFVYDALGRLAERRERVDGSWRATTFESDALGRIVARERANGMRLERAYDAAGRVTELRVLEDGALQSAALRTYRDGRLASIRDTAHGGASELYSYDAAGRVAAVDFPGGESLEVDYDVRSRTTGVALWMPSGSLLRALAFEHDGAGRETIVWDNGAKVVERTYGQGRLTSASFGNGLTRSFGYDAGSGRLASAATVNAAGETLESTLYGLPEESCIDGEPCFQADTRTFGSLASSSLEQLRTAPAAQDGEPLSRAGSRVTQSWSGDGAGRLYTYDELSNVSVLSDPAGAPVYNDERNRLLSYAAGAVQYQYDESGYAIDRNGVEIDWDGRGRVTAVGSDTMHWDTFGRPLSRTVAGIHVGYRFGGLVEADATGAPVALELGQFRVDLVSGSRRYRHLDYRGNVKLVSNEQGEFVTHYRYHAYGVQAVFGSGADPVRFAQGRALRSLAVLGHRLYDPELGRFLAPDPVYQLVNQYAYALGNPVQLWDPMGLEGRVLGFTAAELADGFEGAFVVFSVLAVSGVPGAANAALLSSVGAVVFNTVDDRGGFAEGNFGPDLNPDGFAANGAGGGGGSASGGGGGSLSSLAQRSTLAGPGVFGAIGDLSGFWRGNHDYPYGMSLGALGGFGAPGVGIGGPGGPSAGPGGGAAGGGGCAPTTLTTLPDMRRGLAALLLGQALLGAVVLTYRRRSR